MKKSWKEGAARIVSLSVLCIAMTGMLFAEGRTVSVMHIFNTAPKETDSTEEVQKVAYLTFDDGPSVLTEEYLKILKEENVHATFFLIGQQIEGDLVDVVRQEIEEGHEIGMHTYCHEAEKIYASGESYCQDLQKTKLCLEKKVNIEPRLFRFPWGSANAYIKSYKESVIQQMQQEGIDYADWNVSGEDSIGCPSPDSILSNVRKDYSKYNDPVILLHDSATCKATLASLRPLIQELKDNGYSFQTLSQRERPCHFGEY